MSFRPPVVARAAVAPPGTANSRGDRKTGSDGRAKGERNMRIYLICENGDDFRPDDENWLDKAYPLAKALRDVADSHVGRLTASIEVSTRSRVLADNIIVSEQ